MLQIALSCIEYTKSEDQPIVHLFGRDKDQIRYHIILYHLYPYFYVKASEPVPRNSRIQNVVQSDWKDLQGHPVKCLTMRLPEDVGGNRKDKEGFRIRFKETYEDDVLFPGRCAIKLNVKSGFECEDEIVYYDRDYFKPIDFKVDLRRSHIDIETTTGETNGVLPSPNNPINRIVCITAVDSYTKDIHTFFFKDTMKKRVIPQIYHNPIFLAIEQTIKDLDTENHEITVSLHDYSPEALKRIQNFKPVIDPLDPMNPDDEDLNPREIEVRHRLEQIDKNTERIKELQKQLKTVRKQFKADYACSVHTFNNEPAMLQAFIDHCVMTDTDIPTGWNFKKFDMPYIIARSRKLNVNVNRLSPLNTVYLDDQNRAHIKGRIVFDTWEGYKKTQTSESKSTKLDSVAKKLFCVGKVDHKGIDEMYERNINQLILYNIQDAFLDYAIGENQKIFQFFYDVKCYTGCAFEDVLSNSRIVDAFMLFEAAAKHIVLPSKRNRESDESYKAALVFQAPKPGITHWVGVLDLKSLYPMCMITLNMGEDTFVLNPKPEEIPKLIKSPIDGVYFRKDIPSFLNQCLKKLMDYRAIIQKQMEILEAAGQMDEWEILNRIQTVVKFITNSIFGVLGFINFRLYNMLIAANIPAVGRIVNLLTVKILQKLGYIVHYGDTDSTYPLLKGNTVEACIEEIQHLAKILNQSYDMLLSIFNIDKHFFKTKAEKIYKSLLMVNLKGSEDAAKKHYAGNKVWDDKKGIVDKPDTVGFDRSDMSIIANAVQRQVLEYACYERKGEIVDYLKAEIHKIKTTYSLGDIAFTKGIKMPFEEYVHPGDWVRAAMWTNTHSRLWHAQTNYGAGTKPKFIYVKPSKLPKGYAQIEIIALDENDSLPQNLVDAIDWDMVIKKTIQAKVETVLQAVGIDFDYVMQKTDAVKLGQY